MAVLEVLVPHIFRSLFLLTLSVIGTAVCTPSLSAASASQAEVERLDQNFSAALNKGDQAAVAKWLDPEFSWTNRSGKTQSKQEFMASLSALTTDAAADVQAMDAGKVVLIHGTHRDVAQNATVRFLRVWVKRPSAWQLFVYQETTKPETPPEKRSGFGSPSDGAPVSCDNPCKTVPYKPDNPAAQEVVSMWQAVELTVLTNDVDAWAPNFTEDFLFVTPDGGTPLNKADRVTMIKELRRTNTTLIPAEVLSMQVWIFGDSAVMRSEHKPKHGKVLHITRLFEKHDGRWQIAFGQQTWVE
jgi:ketosteroid isomerase-like protein